MLFKKWLLIFGLSIISLLSTTCNTIFFVKGKKNQSKSPRHSYSESELKCVNNVKGWKWFEGECFQVDILFISSWVAYVRSLWLSDEIAQHQGFSSSNNHQILEKKPSESLQRISLIAEEQGNETLMVWIREQMKYVDHDYYKGDYNKFFYMSLRESYNQIDGWQIDAAFLFALKISSLLSSLMPTQFIASRPFGDEGNQLNDFLYSVNKELLSILQLWNKARKQENSKFNEVSEFILEQERIMLE